MIGFGQNSEATALKKQIIKIKPTALLLGDLSVFYEREIVNKHSLTIGIPLYFKRDIAKMTIIKSLAPLFMGDASKNDVERILDDAEGIGSLGGYGIVLKYKFYLNQNAEALTGFYFSPEYYFRKFNIKIDASEADINEIWQKHFQPSFLDFTGSYELDGFIKTNIISFNFGHQWIKNWFSIDFNIGLAHYSIRYDFEGERKVWGNLGAYYEENDIKDTESIWLPRAGLNLGVAF